MGPFSHSHSSLNRLSEAGLCCHHWYKLGDTGRLPGGECLQAEVQAEEFRGREAGVWVQLFREGTWLPLYSHTRSTLVPQPAAHSPSTGHLHCLALLRLHLLHRQASPHCDTTRCAAHADYNKPDRTILYSMGGMPPAGGTIPLMSPCAPSCVAVTCWCPALFTIQGDHFLTCAVFYCL